MKKVAVLFSGNGRRPVAEKAFLVLKSLGIDWSEHIISAHKTPEAAVHFAKTARARDYGVLIACDGEAAHLAGALAAYTTLPVIGVPCSGGLADGLDALLSTIQMPCGVPVAAVTVDGGANAAYLAAQILSLTNAELARKLAKHRQSAAKETAALNRDSAPSGLLSRAARRVSSDA
jgi:5-(carboxyamino)imidazole ribonucleotide mutase